MVFVRILLHRLIVLEPVEPGEVLTVREPRKAGGGEINPVGDALYSCRCTPVDRRVTRDIW